MKLFGTDGVRGQAGVKLSAFTAMKLAMAAGIYFRKHSVTNTILLGKDTRRSGYMIENAIVSGLTAVGYNVRQIGPMPTPAIAFLTEDMRCDGGIMISASHNPYFDNGIKFFDNKGDKLKEAQELKIEEIFNDEKVINKNQQINMKIGSSKRVDDVIGRYIVHIKNSFPKNLNLHNFRVVLDAANGAAYKVAPTIFSELGAEVIVIADEPDGKNINQACGALHPEILCEQVKKLRADVGFAFDGDADRLVVVNEKGCVVDGDNLLATLTMYLKKRKKLEKPAIVTTTMSNLALEHFLKDEQISLKRSDVGDKFVLDMMKKEGINFGGEQSGHIIFSDFAKTGDALVAAMQLMAYMILEEKAVSELCDNFSLYPQILKNVNITKKIPLDEINELVKFEADLKQSNIRSLIRYSGTENVIRLLFEGADESLILQKANEAEKIAQKFLNV